MRILHYLPCDGWYFVYNTPTDRVLMRVALWAVIQRQDRFAGASSSASAPRPPHPTASMTSPVGSDAPTEETTTEVVGMVSIRRSVDDLTRLTLEPVPAGEGCYVHEHDLSGQEREILASYRASS